LQTVLLADDHAQARSRVRVALERAGLEVLSEATNGLDAVAHCKSLQPHLVVLDPSLPRMSGIDAARQISRFCPETTILFVTPWADDHLLARALSAGAGDVSKARAATALIPAIVAAKHGASDAIAA
jgi:DNA-binding NarL/FixJ family response regulator